MNEKLVELLKPEISLNFIEIVRCLEFDVVFDIKISFAGFTGGRLSLNENSLVELVVVLSGKNIILPWDGVGVISSIERSKAFENTVRKSCTPTAFCDSNIPLLPMYSNRTACTCSESQKINQRLIAIDLSFPQISRHRGIIIVEQCSNTFCKKWSVSTFTLDARKVNTLNSLKSLVEELCQLQGILLPNYNSILDSVTFKHKKYAVRTSKRQKAITQNKISALKGLTLEEIKAKGLKF